MNNVMKKKGHINPKIHVFIKYASPSNIAKVLFDAKKKKKCLLIMTVMF